MNRRTFLTLCSGACTTALAGCSAVSSSDTPSVIAPSSIDRTPASEPVSLEIIAQNQRPTSEEPAHFQVTLTNTSVSPVQYTTGYRTVFSGHRAENDNGEELLLLNSNRSDKKDGDCWKRASEFSAPERNVETRIPGETSKTLDLYVWAGPNASACPPRGEFRFEQTYRRNPESETSADGGQPSQFTWGFTLLVEDDE